MKKIIYAAVVLMILAIACNENENKYRDYGTITGIDFRECFCCGGYFIEIRDSTYRFLNLPAGSDIGLENAKFPVYVKLDWQIADSLCLGDEIKVFRIAKR